VPPPVNATCRPHRPVLLQLGGRRYDLTTRALVVGILNRTKDSFYDHGSYFELDRFFERAEQLVKEGADVLDVGGVKAGPGPEVTEEEELERVVPVIASLRERFDVPLSVDTWRASVAAAAFSAGAVLGNDISGFADPAYLPAAAVAGASVVATHIRLSPRVPDPDPHYEDVVAEVERFLLARAENALSNGIGADRIVLDAGLDLGKTAEQSLLLLQSSARLASLGYALLLSSSNKTFLGVLLGLGIGERREASLASAAMGIAGGCRLVRVHDVAGTCKVRDLLAAIAESAPEAAEATQAHDEAAAGTIFPAKTPL
jgi:dihydropteroate synthase